MKTPFARHSRRRFLKAASVFTTGLAMGKSAFSADQGRVGSAGAPSLADLPKGAAPKPVSFPHFPSRLHAFVWRNWPLVPVERMAEVGGARPADIRRLGAAMGLGKPPRITRDQQRRSYITVLRRNWHLLPYEQLLALLAWTPDEMAYTLREDDFLFIKLGNLKPQCEPLRFQPSDEKTQQRERAIAEIVRRDFPNGAADATDPLFSFVAKLSARHPTSGIREPVSDDSIRFCYSYFALYGDPLLDTESAPFPDGYLARLAGAGVNGVWLQALLYKLAPFPWTPKLSERYEERLKNLRALVAQARRHGIRVFLYLNEPRAMPLKFFETRPQMKGVVEGDHAALCTSDPDVQQFLRESVATICRAVPDLGGFFTITGSENLTNCWSHGSGAHCPRCGKRPPADVIAEVNRLIFEGIQRSANPSSVAADVRRFTSKFQGPTPQSRITLLAWDWGWNDAWAEGIINQLPPEVALMSVSEWSLPIKRGGVKSAVGEYSISAIGPGPRAQRHWAFARKRGLKTIAKIQAGNTWELSAVPYIPAVENVARHAANLRGSQVNGLMLGWTLGGYPSPNLETVSEALASGSPAEAMQRVAERRFGKALAPSVVAAWREFSAAFSEFPYDGGVVYSAPQQYGPANLLWAAPTGYRATMVGFPYDDLDTWRAIYPPEVFIGQLKKVADGFDQAVARLKNAASEQTAKLTRSERQSLEGELSVAEAAAIHFRSTANQARFVVARRALLAARSGEETARPVAALEQILEEEIALARRLHAIQMRDSRIGFEASNHYFYVSVDLAEKVLNCRDLLDRWLPSLRTTANR
jgi:hypothetical protein